MSIKKSISTVFLSALAVIFLIQAIAATALFLTPMPVQAAGDKEFSMNLEVPLPTLNNGNANIKFTGDTGPIAAYIKAIYNFAVGAVGIVAAVVLMIGGLMWITAGGNSSTVTEATSMIIAALTGLVLVFTSYLLLSQINPALVNLSADVNGIKTPELIKAPLPSSIACHWTWNTSMLPMGSISGSGNVISADSMCTETKPTDKDNPQCLCTYQSNPALNCSWSKETTCSAGNIGIPVTHEDSYGTSQAGNLPAIKECGSSGFENSKICCCPPANKSCVNCSAIGAAGIPISPNACCTNCAVTIPCQASSDLIAELLKFKDIYNNWQVTGAAPPTPGIHKSSCHTAGTCVDLNSSNPKALFDALKKQDTPMKSFQYECTDSNSCCSELYSYMGSYCKDKSNDMGFDATANHFHVNQ